MSIAYNIGKRKLFKDMNLYQIIRRLNLIENMIYEYGMADRSAYWVNKHLPRNIVHCDDPDANHSGSSDDHHNETLEQTINWGLLKSIHLRATEIIKNH